MAIFEGSGVALVTPFTKDGIDFDAYGRLVEFQIQNGTRAIIACGTTGEPSTMSFDERLSVIRYTVEKVHGRIPVVASTGGNNTAEVIRASLAAQEVGADALMVVTPYYNKATQKGLIAHYTAIADAVSLPIIIYNVPGRTGVNMLPATLATLSHHPHIAAMKEASGNIEQFADMARLCEDRITLYSGEDALTLVTMALGGKGVISVAANIVPQDVAALCDAMFQNDLVAARQIQFKLNPLIKALFSEVNPIPVKTALGLMGMCSPSMRLPLCAMEDATYQGLCDAMRTYGLSIK